MAAATSPPPLDAAGVLRVHREWRDLRGTRRATPASGRMAAARTTPRFCVRRRPRADVRSAFVPLRLIARTTVPAEWRFVDRVKRGARRKERARRARLTTRSHAMRARCSSSGMGTSLPARTSLRAASLGEALATDSLASNRLIELVERSPDCQSSRREALVRRLTHFILRGSARAQEAARGLHVRQCGGAVGAGFSCSLSMRR